MESQVKKFRALPSVGPSHKISDKSRLLWERYFGPMQAAAIQLNVAVRNTEGLIASAIIEAEGFSVDTHVFNIDNLTIVPRPQAPQVKDSEHAMG